MRHTATPGLPTRTLRMRGESRPARKFQGGLDNSSGYPITIYGLWGSASSW
jgi:hypothetical protein